MLLARVSSSTDGIPPGPPARRAGPSAAVLNRSLCRCTREVEERERRETERERTEREREREREKVRKRQRQRQRESDVVRHQPSLLPTPDAHISAPYTALKKSRYINSPAKPTKKLVPYTNHPNHCAVPKHTEHMELFLRLESENRPKRQEPNLQQLVHNGSTNALPM